MVDMEKEEQILQLRSEVEIYKQKAKTYKQKLRVELEAFKKSSLAAEKNNCFKDLARMEVELTEQKNTIETRDQQIE